jgi:hypothetical protein
MTEITIAPGEDTHCDDCQTSLPAGAPAWTERDGILCCDCAERVAA